MSDYADYYDKPNDCRHRHVNSISGRCCVCGEKVQPSDVDRAYSNP